MKIVIDIPDKLVTDIKDYCGMSIADAKESLPIILNAIHNGTPLPKGHGRLIDADMVLAETDELKKSPWYNEDINGSYVVRKDAVGMVEDLCVKKAPTIIEADKAEGEVEE